MMVLLSGCGPSVRLYSDIDDSARFDQYSTYSFLEFGEGNIKTINGMELERIRVAFAREIEKHGLTFVEAGGDVSFKITVYHRQAASGYGYGGIYNYMERAIAVDMYDNQSMRHIWHCAASGELENDTETRMALLPVVVSKIFQRYPVPATAGS
jgi:hypothetical protein